MAAEFPPGVVRGQAMISASLNVEADKVQAKLLPVLLEQMVRQLGREGSVKL